MVQVPSFQTLKAFMLFFILPKYVCKLGQNHSNAYAHAWYIHYSHVCFCERLLTIKTYIVFGPILILLLSPDIHTALNPHLLMLNVCIQKET